MWISRRIMYMYYSVLYCIRRHLRLMSMAGVMALTPRYVATSSQMEVRINPRAATRCSPSFWRNESVRRVHGVVASTHAAYSTSTMPARRIVVINTVSSGLCPSEDYESTYSRHIVGRDGDSHAKDYKV